MKNTADKRKKLNKINQLPNKPSRFFTVLRCLLGGCLVVFAIAVALVNWWAACLWLIAAVLILPPVAKKFSQKTGVVLSGLFVCLGLMVGVLTGKTTLPNAWSITVQNSQTNTQSDEILVPKTSEKSQTPTKLKKNQQVHCKIIKISDGDTATCLTDDKVQLKIRLWQIDAPENGQAFGKVAKKSLSDLIFGKYVMLKVHQQDRYGRTVGEIYLGQQNINKQMVKNGMAWAYKEYVKDQEYLSLENTAKRQKLGLWIDKNPVYPSHYRKQKAQNQTANSP